MTVEYVDIELGESDESGWRHPIVKPDSQFLINVDSVVVALGNNPNPLIAAITKPGNDKMGYFSG
jgi:glutamate synthase (NADPH/NADH) small chain